MVPVARLNIWSKPIHLDTIHQATLSFRATNNT